VRQPFAQAHDAREPIDDAQSALSIRRCDQHSAIVGAQIQRRKERRPLSRARLAAARRRLTRICHVETSERGDAAQTLKLG
jgi:hypothetical protein